MFSAGNTLTLIVCIILHVRIAKSLGYHQFGGGDTIYSHSCFCNEVSTEYNDVKVEQLNCTFTFALDGFFFLPVFLNKLVGHPTAESCADYNDMDSSSREEVNSTTAIAKTKECGNNQWNNTLVVGTSIVTASAVNISVTFCKYEQHDQSEDILLLPVYRNNCPIGPRSVDEGFCYNIFSEVTTTTTNAHNTNDPDLLGTSDKTGSKRFTTSAPTYATHATYSTYASEVSDTRAERILAAGLAVASIIIFIIAIVLVLLCCRRMSYRMNLKKGKQSNTPPTVIENASYISVDNGVAASTNNIPVYAKPDKGNRQPANGATNSGYEKPPVTKPRDSGYEEATLSPIRHLVDDDISNKPPATPPRPRSAARKSTPADGYEEANLPSSNDNINTSSGMTNSSAGYEDNFVKPGGSSGYEDNFVTMQTGTKESIKYDHLKRKNGNDGKTGLDVEAAEGYGQVRSKSDLVDAEEYQHLTHDKKAGDHEPGYGKLGKDRKS